MKEHCYFVYLMASRTRVLYCGMTNNLVRRVAEHKSGEIEGFSKMYQCHRLVWFERFQYVGNAIERERQIKNWRREKKIERIQETNPSWADLSEGWYHSEQSAGPSTALRFGRDDNHERKSAGPSTALRFGRDDNHSFVKHSGEYRAGK
ncbi:MAG TPA: GIY-YIG nuclease family protein [Acidobacteriaceae bacterium]|nr:GIY-YIG nuclease family protein [Acidobacteriaceae bacterium]